MGEVARRTGEVVRPTLIGMRLTVAEEHYLFGSGDLHMVVVRYCGPVPDGLEWVRLVVREVMHNALGAEREVLVRVSALREAVRRASAR